MMDRSYLFHDGFPFLPRVCCVIYTVREAHITLKPFTVARTEIDLHFSNYIYNTMDMQSRKAKALLTCVRSTR